MILSRRTRRKLNNAAQAALRFAKKLGSKRVLAALLCLAIVFGIFPQTDGGQAYAVDWKDITRIKGNNVDNTKNAYVLEVSSGTRVGGGYADNILYFAVHYTDIYGTKRNVILMPTIDAVSNGYKLAKSVGYPTDRINNVARLFDYTQAVDLVDRRALGSVTSDQILFETPEPVQTIDQIQVFGKNTPSASVWPCQGMRVYRVDHVYGLEMYGWYSSMGFIDFDGTIIAEVVMAPGGGNFNWATTGGTYNITPMQAGIPKEVTLVNTSDKEAFENANGKITHVGMEVKSGRNDPVIIRMDFADQGGSGFESQMAFYSDTVKKPTIAQSEFTEAAALTIRYEDIFGDIRDVTLPLIVNSLGAAVDILGENIAIAAYAQQGDSIAIPAFLPNFSDVISTTISMGERNACEAAGLVHVSSQVSAQRSSRIEQTSRDSIDYTCLAFYTEVETKLGLDGAVIRYSFDDEHKNKPIRYSAATSVDGLKVDASQTTRINLYPYNDRIQLEPSDHQYKFLITLSTDVVANSGTRDDLQIQFKYVNLKDKDVESPLYHVKDYVDAFYGQWPAANIDDFAYAYTMRQSGTTQFIIPLQDVKKFTGIAFKLEGEDEWQFVGASIALVQDYGKRNIGWAELASIESDINGVPLYRANAVVTRNVVAPKVSFQVGEIYNEGDDRPDPGTPEWDPGTLVQDDDETTEFNGDGEVVDKKDEIDWDEIFHYMTYEQACRDLKFTKQRTYYKVTIKVAGSKVNEDDDDCGSKNLFYMQLLFENGSSGCTLVNQQLQGDAFNTGAECDVYIPCAQDYGDLTDIVIIPDDQDGNSDIYDKLKIQYITVEKVTDDFMCPTWAVRSNDADGLGWVGIDYREQGEMGTNKGAQGRTLADVATTYHVTESSYNAKFLVSIKTGAYGSSLVLDESGRQILAPDKNYYGGMSMKFAYFDRNGEYQEKQYFDIVDLMYKYASRKVSHDRKTSLSEENVKVEYCISDPAYLFRAETTDSFFITVENISKFISMSLLLKSDLVTKWTVDDVRIYLVNGQGYRYLNGNGEYDYRYAGGKNPTLVAEWDREGSVTTSVGIYRYKEDTASQEVKNMLLRCEPINLNPDAAGWSSVISREPKSKNDTFNLYLYPQAGSEDVTDPSRYDIKAAVRYKNAMTLSQMQVSAGTLRKAYNAEGDVYCMYATGLSANNLDSIMGVDIDTNTLTPVTARISSGLIQVIRGGVLISSYPLNGTLNADMGATLNITTNPRAAHREKVYIQLSDDTKEQTLEQDAKDLAVALYFRPDTPDRQEYRSKYVYLTDAGYTSVKGGQVYELDLELGDLAAITGASIVSIGVLESKVDSILAVELDSAGNVYNTFSSRQPVTATNRATRVNANGSVQLLTLEVRTATDSGSVTSGTKGPIRMTVGYYDTSGTFVEEVYDNIRPYISSGKGFASGGTDIVRVMVPELAELRWVEFEPAHTAGQTVGTWKIDSLTATVGADGENVSRNLDTLVIEGDPLRVSLADIFMTANASVNDSNGNKEASFSVSSGSSGATMLTAGSTLTVDTSVYGSVEGSTCTVEGLDPSTGATASVKLGTTYSYTDQYLNDLLSSAQDSAQNGYSDAEKAAAARVAEIVSGMLSSAGSFDGYYDTYVFKAPVNYTGRDMYYRMTVTANELPSVYFTVDVTSRSVADPLPDALSVWRTEQSSAKQDAEAAAAAVDSKINAIGTVALTSECEAAIADARGAYDALYPTHKSLVKNTAVLEAAEKSLADMKAAKAVKDKIDAIGTVTLSAESETLINNARAANDALTDDQKDLVDNYSVLVAAEQKYADLKAVNDVTELINAIGTVTLDSEAAIIEARDAYDALAAGLKSQITNLSVLEAAETRLAELKAETP